MRILVAEDEIQIAHFVRQGLFEAGHEATICDNGDTALKLATSESFDALVLDITMPGYDGLDVLRRLRAEHNHVPVILLTARDGVLDRIIGLNYGADDYVPKPFSVDELIARLGAVWRRLNRDELSLLQLGDLTLNLATREVRRADKKIKLSPKEFSLLAYMMRSPGLVHTRSQLCWHVWDQHFDSGTNVVDVAIQRLRRKVDADQRVPLLHAVRGVGYTAKVEV